MPGRIVIKLHHVLLPGPRVEIFNLLRKDIPRRDARARHFLCVVVTAAHGIAQAAGQAVALGNEMDNLNAGDILPARTKVREAGEPLRHDCIAGEPAPARRHIQPEAVVNAVDSLLIAQSYAQLRIRPARCTAVLKARIGFHIAA